MHVSTEDVNALFRRHQGVILLLFVSLLLRSYYLVGFGLGDDAYYASTSLNFLKYGFKALPLSFGSNYRIGIWIPTALSFALFGVNDFSFVLFALASSTLLVLVVYLIALELADEKVALFSAIIQAFSPFDIGFASTLTIDIPSNLLLALSMLFFIKGGVVRRYSSVFYFFSGFCIVWSYFIKIPALSMMLVYAAITITQIRQLKRHIFFYLIFGFLFGSTLAIDFLLSGNPINYVVQEIKFTAKPGFFSDLWMLYPEWMFTARNWLGVMFFGYHFWLAVPAGVYCLLSRDLRGRVWPVFLWFSVSLIFLEFYPLHWSLPYMVSPRFFRYTHQFVPPASLLAGFFLSSIWAKLSKSSYRRYLETVFALSLLLYCLVSASNGLEISETYKSHYDDVRFASGYLMSLEPKRIYSDNNVADKYNFYTSYERMWQVPFEYNGLRMQYDVVSGNRIWLLYGLNDSYVVLGGSRGVDYGSNWILNQGHSVLPGNWTLIWGYDQELDSHRFEPLRIYYVK